MSNLTYNLRDMALKSAMSDHLTEYPDGMTEMEVLSVMSDGDEPEDDSEDGQFIVYQPFEGMPLPELAEIIEHAADNVEDFATGYVNALAEGITDGDFIIVRWCIEDVKSAHPNLTDDQCREVLRRAKKYHDCNVGINWDVLACHADDVRSGT